MFSLLNLFISISIISVIVIFHEFGHYIVARMNGVQVDEFSIGMGPELMSFVDSKQTRWSFRLIPLGGYISCDDSKLSFFKKILLYLGGPINNFIFAFLVLFVSFKYFGNVVQFPHYNGELISKIEKIDNNQHNVTFVNGATTKLQTAELKKGVTYKDKYYAPLPTYAAVQNAFWTTWYRSKQTICYVFSSICNMSLRLGGPVAIINGTNKIVQKDIRFVFQWMVMISIGLGVINLVPIFPLDGGRILHATLSLISQNLAAFVAQIGMYIAMGLFAYVMLNDLKPVMFSTKSIIENSYSCVKNMFSKAKGV